MLQSSPILEVHMGPCEPPNSAYFGVSSQNENNDEEHVRRSKISYIVKDLRQYFSL